MARGSPGDNATVDTAALYAAEHCTASVRPGRDGTRDDDHGVLGAQAPLACHDAAAGRVVPAATEQRQVLHAGEYTCLETEYTRHSRIQQHGNKATAELVPFVLGSTSFREAKLRRDLAAMGERQGLFGQNNVKPTCRKSGVSMSGSVMLNFVFSVPWTCSGTLARCAGTQLDQGLGACECVERMTTSNPGRLQATVVVDTPRSPLARKHTHLCVFGGSAFGGS